MSSLFRLELPWNLVFGKSSIDCCPVNDYHQGCDRELNAICRFRQKNAAGRMRRKPEFLLLRMAVLLLLSLFSLQWDASASPDCSRKTPGSTSGASVSEPLRLNALTSSGEMLEPAAISADLDGDHYRDLVAAQIAGDQYKVIVALSSHSHLKVLIPPVQLGGFTVRVCDFNEDGYQDIVVTAPAVLHPMAVWLGNGKGDFEPADQIFFKNDFGLTEPPRYRSYPISFDQDLLLNPAHTVCEKMSLAFVHAGPEPNGFIVEQCGSVALPSEYSCITLRSPPFIVS